MEDRGSIKLAGTLLLSCGLVVLCAVSCVATRANDFGNALPITDGLSLVAGHNARVKPSSYEVTHTRQPSTNNTAPRGGSKPGQTISGGQAAASQPHELRGPPTNLNTAVWTGQTGMKELPDEAFRLKPLDCIYNDTGSVCALPASRYQARPVFNSISSDGVDGTHMRNLPQPDNSTAIEKPGRWPIYIAGVSRNTGSNPVRSANPLPEKGWKPHSYEIHRASPVPCDAPAFGVRSATSVTNGDARRDSRRDGILFAIAQVETGNNPHAIGKAGERGRHQLSAAAWKHSGVLLKCWCVRRPSARELLSHTAHEEVHAAAYLRFLSSYLTESGHQSTPANLAVAWNIGPRSFRRLGFSLHRCPSAVRDYAKRVENLTKQ